jgi:2'-5' RNA ligase
LWPPDPVRQQLFAWAQACHPCTGGRLVRRENLHATVAFLGEIAPSRVVELAALVRETGGERFELVLDRVGYWAQNRIVYAGAAKVPQALSSLAAALTQRLARAGFRTDERPYCAHVTLLRAARKAPDARRIEPLRWRVDAIVLMESIRTDSGLVYRTADRWTLAD